MEALPPEVAIYLAQFLPRESDILSLRLTCAMWNSLLSDDVFWMHWTKRRYPQTAAWVRPADRWLEICKSLKWHEMWLNMQPKLLYSREFADDVWCAAYVSPEHAKGQFAEQVSADPNFTPIVVGSRQAGPGISALDLHSQTMVGISRLAAEATFSMVVHNTNRDFLLMRGTGRGKVEIIRNWNRVDTLNHSSAVYSVSYANGKLLSAGGTINVWDVETCKRLLMITEYDGTNTAGISNNIVVATGGNSAVGFIDLRTSKTICRVSAAHNGSIWDTKVDLAADIAAVGSYDRSVSLWSLERPVEIPTDVILENKLVRSVAFDCTTHRMAMGLGDGSTSWWSLSGEKKRTVETAGVVSSLVRCVVLPPTTLSRECARFLTCSGRDLAVYEMAIVRDKAAAK